MPSVAAAAAAGAAILSRPKDQDVAFPFGAAATRAIRVPPAGGVPCTAVSVRPLMAMVAVVPTAFTSSAFQTPAPGLRALNLLKSIR
jgi:hypothetical protein